MYMYDFTYRRPATLAEAAALFAGADSPAFLSGGHTLLPTMKNRLAMPDLLIDLRAIPELAGIRHQGGRLEIGAASTHEAVAASPEVRAAIPALAALAGSIADPQVRRVGTIGGSVANNDPAADYPAALLGLGAEIVTDRRSVPADDFFEGLFTTALEDGEIVLRISVPVPEAAGYAKLCSQASRYAVAGVFASRTGRDVRVAVTGAGSDGVFRWAEAEAALSLRWDGGRSTAGGGRAPRQRSR
ncbi:FAD binding domain-containing protein [Mangrovicoccus ximenensis]|uniref:FAD binding domain-containing protein n=1 Tax=Mangrovicoccus ximenensis TaxID=1911570 RepID=UPI001F35CBD1|nr:FAD binding domain-containing protein [Mangrovicoccus ximenensis]